MSEFDGRIELDDDERELLEDAAELLDDAGYDLTEDYDLGMIRGDGGGANGDDRIAVSVDHKGSWSISHTDATEGGGGPEGILERVDELIEYHSEE